MTAAAPRTLPGRSTVLGLSIGADGATAALVAGDGARIDAVDAVGPPAAGPLPDAVAALDLAARPDAVGLIGGDGDAAAALATALGLPVVHDFAAGDLGLGGRGRPLEPVALFALVRHLRLAGRTAVLTGGEAAVLTLIDPAAPGPDAPGALSAWDVGPPLSPVPDGALPDRALAERLAARTPAFARHPPRLHALAELDGIEAALAPLPPGTAAATRLAIAAHVIARSLAGDPPARLLAPPDALPGLAALPCPVAPLPHADVLPAVVAAHLAHRVLRGLPTTFPATTGVAAPVGGGQVVRPGPEVRSAALPRPGAARGPGRSRG